MKENEITGQILDAGIEVHRTLGRPGLLESFLEEALVWELQSRGLFVERQKSVPISYKGQLLATPLYIDILVENQIIVECKATEKHNPVYESQTLTYLRLMNLRLGMVINFGHTLIKNGIHRVINNRWQETL